MTEFDDYTQPLVSVIIPTYNRLEYLQEAIASAVNQTYRHLDILVCDNCSDLSPQAIIDSFQDSRIRLWRNTKNLGMVANIKNGFKMAWGKYVASLHDDDIWEEDFLVKLVPMLEANPHLAVAFSDCYIINSKGIIDHELTAKNSQTFKRSELKTGIYQPFYEQGIINMSVASANAAVIRKEVVNWDEIPLEVGGCYDLYINYLCSRSGLGAYYSSEKLTRYRQHPQSDTLTDNPISNIRKAKNHLFCYEQFIADPNLEKFQAYFQQRLLAANFVLAQSFLQDGQPETARFYFSKIIQQKKNSLRAILGLLLTFIPKSERIPIWEIAGFKGQG
ncbi:glycosyl transferase, family 2 [Richelia sinica FACHB-800]|uniref:Glycosyl transferase, family 2 n=1 Tax=Richelia sinica FACHB-800 TaxID=1357546 RepID=A0A975T8V6_9NOST|nr:glycosyltransferase family 2 protein [Richelia sinica]MBD2665782.1 glycosyltransferase family 2 protein [Richelia sinica FACHB-800]QXE23597.1 glycosyl transferase, family 2 [Richelia sinica FACHB-800]